MFGSSRDANSSSSGADGGLIYDFDDEENALKWKGVFVASLHKVVFPSIRRVNSTKFHSYCNLFTGSKSSSSNTPGQG